MVYKVHSGRVGGLFSDLITVEVDISNGLPSFDIIGLPGNEVKEAKDRVRIALRNCGITIPSVKITVNLSPADEHKTGSAFDLPIAMAILGALGHLGTQNLEDSIIIGELSLDGKLLGIGGVLPIVKMAFDKGFMRVILPKVNYEEARLIKEINVIPMETISELISFLMLDKAQKEHYLIKFDSDSENRRASNDSKKDITDEPDFLDVYGQEHVKRAAAIAASGFHHFLMTGPPGCGKSLIAKRIPGIMPPLEYDEKIEISTIYSVAGKLERGMELVDKRPFYAPHYSASIQSLTGGGVYAKPGLVSLSHKGILFLDELPEFKKDALEALRQPLEDKMITVSRAKRTYSYPAEFMLVGAMNPCPCGYFPDRNRCNCNINDVKRYLSKLSGPVLDRIDICVELSKIDIDDLMLKNKTGLSSLELRQKVEKAVNLQAKRFSNEKFRFNSEIPSSKIDAYIPLGDKETDFINSIYKAMNLSARSLYKLLKVARTIADYDGDEIVEVKHIAEASLYRFPDYLGRQ